MEEDESFLRQDSRTKSVSYGKGLMDRSIISNSMHDLPSVLGEIGLN